MRKVPLMSTNMIKQSTQSENLSLKPEVETLLIDLGVEPVIYTSGTLVKTPITGETVAHVREVDAAGTTSAMAKAHAAFGRRVGNDPQSLGRRCGGDDGGWPILIERMDRDAYLASVELAPGKARTAALFKKLSQALEDAINRGRVAVVTARGFTEMQGGFQLLSIAR
jgi:hypothetical protein